MKSLLLILLSVIGLLLHSCLKKDVEVLPEESQSGKGTFACMYDGTLLNIKGAYAVYHRSASHKQPVINIIANHSLSINPEIITIATDNINAIGMYPLRLTNTVVAAKIIGEDDYFRSVSGTLEITTLDTINHIISGNFDCGLTKNGFDIYGELVSLGGDTIHIRSGRFDLPLSVK